MCIRDSFKCSELNVNVRFTAVTPERYNNWVGRQGKSRYIVTILGKVITAKQLSKVTKAVSDQNLNIDSIKRLTGRPSLQTEDENAVLQHEVTDHLRDRFRARRQNQKAG